MPERILVTGATGKLGREIVRLLHGRGETVRAATRFPTDAARLFDDAVEIVEMDYQATETWDNAVQWVDRLFLMPPPFDPHAFETLAPFLDWAVGSGTHRVVLLSAMAIDREPDLALVRLERHLAALDIPSTALRPNLYMQNLSSGFILDSIRERGAIETSTTGGRISFVDATDVAEVAAIALTDDSLTGSTVTLTGEESLGFDDIAKRISAATGRAVEWRTVPAERMRDVLRAARLSEAAADVALELLASIERGEREPVHPDLSRILGRPAAPFDRFLAANADVWR